MPYSLMIHGGAGLIEGLSEELRDAYRASLTAIIVAGKKMLENGSSAFDAVMHCDMLLEADHLFNAGRWRRCARHFGKFGGSDFNGRYPRPAMESSLSEQSCQK